MARAIYVSFWFCLILASCTERLVCPAYQSAFIYDKDQLRKKFSYFQEDSTPKVFTASKTKYLIAEPTPYRKKLRSLQTVPMKKVLVQVPDSISGIGQDSVITADLDRAARSVIDSTFAVDVPEKDTTQTEEDSTYVITKDKEIRVLKYNMPDSLEYDAVSNKYVPQKPKYYVDEVGYNMEQDNYMWYLRHSLVLPDVRLAKMQGKGNANASGKKAKSKQKKGIFGFFKNLFKKKKKEQIDSAALKAPRNQEEEFNYIDTTAQVNPQAVQQSKAKKVKSSTEKVEEEEVTTDTQAQVPVEKPSKKKRKKKSDKKKDELPKPEQKKNEDDGF